MVIATTNRQRSTVLAYQRQTRKNNFLINVTRHFTVTIFVYLLQHSTYRSSSLT